MVSETFRVSGSREQLEELRALLEEAASTSEENLLEVTDTIPLSPRAVRTRGLVLGPEGYQILVHLFVAASAHTTVELAKAVLGRYYQRHPDMRIDQVPDATKFEK